MGSHDDCASWDYEKHPNRSRVGVRALRLQQLMVDYPGHFLRYGLDTRSGHRFLFFGLAPSACLCLVGEYRGSATCAALTSYGVHVPADPRVGVDPRLVGWQMQQFERDCAAACDAYEDWQSQSGPKAAPEAALLRFVQILCDALERILWIHPYANGNGHAGRLLVFAMLARHGFAPKRWSIDPKMPYSAALSQYRDGNKKPLVSFVLSTLRP
jgi:hypothetical protein